MKRRTDLPVLLLHNVDSSWSPDEIEQTLREVSALESAIRQEGHPVVNVPVHDSNLKTILSLYDPDDYVVLNWCEDLPGLAHSDALVAHTLETLRFSYTGSPPSVLALSWDKPLVKRLLKKHRVPTPRWKVYTTSKIKDWKEFPAIVKPAGEHCSIGVDKGAVVLGEDELRARVAYVLEAFHQAALVEDFIDGREFHISVLGDKKVTMLPPAEMDFAAFNDVRDRLCTFDSKFTPGSDHYKEIRLQLPAELTDSEYISLEKTASSAYSVLGCRDYARIDIRLRNGVFYVLDVNPNADISYETSIVCAAEVAGYSYGAMLSYLINLAARRHPRFGNLCAPETNRRAHGEAV
ncbi:MAG: ATP-grasp domain-containing protein [Desulfobacterales bacterium]|nr:ATP-grasp domain-containing protein [Desulfobacterales bacterium]